MRQSVARRARECCEYCRSQFAYSPDPFVVEHIIPRDEGGDDDQSNLAFSCAGCNGHKYTKTKAQDTLTGRIVSVFHPRREYWQDHFEWSTDLTLIIGLTPTGRATVEALHLNRPGVVNLRRLLIATGAHPPSDEERNGKH